MVDAVKIAKALSDPTRYKIMKLLARAEQACCTLPGNNDPRPGLCNCELMAELDMIQSRISYHMKELTDTGLVTEEPRGKWRVYFINAGTLKQYIEQLNRDLALSGEQD